tara:strand:+ start:263 stop:463 length:201 start_codon:yes stop_codon:yes gene_type:complete
MNILSPCLISVILIIIYLLLSPNNQSKIKKLINKNQVIIIVLVAGYIMYVNYEGFKDDGKENCGSK